MAKYSRFQPSSGTMKKPREESQIFEVLAALAASLGYVHAVAHICNRENVIYSRTS
jgi:hypothetical protein